VDLTWLPGIPTYGTKAYNSFLISFVSGTYSGFLYSIFTGVIVGVILLIAQWKTDSRIARRGYQREFALLKERIRQIIDYPDEINISSAVESIPPVAIKLGDEIEKFPIDLLMDEFPASNEFIKLLKDVQKTRAEFVVTAAELDNLLSNFVRKFNISREAIYTNDKPLINYIISRLNGVDACTAATTVLPICRVSDKLEQGYLEGLKLDHISNQVKLYLEMRANIFEKVKLINDYLK